MLDSKQTFEEAKVIDEILKRTAMNEDGKIDKMRFLLLLAGMMTETLIEYEEPDAVMEQSFHRISQLIHATPIPDNLAKFDVPPSHQIDIETEIGREIARESEDRLKGGLDDVHEVVIAIAYNQMVEFAEDGLPLSESLRIMIEAVIQSLVFEMATQEFGDLIIEDFISEGWPISEVLITLGGVSGYYLSLSDQAAKSKKDWSEDYIVGVMAGEAVRNGLGGSTQWSGLESANDMDTQSLVEDIAECVEIFDEFFNAVNLHQNQAKAVAVAKTAGRMAALVSGKEMNLVQPALAKVLLKTGFRSGYDTASK